MWECNYICKRNISLGEMNEKLRKVGKPESILDLQITSDPKTALSLKSPTLAQKPFDKSSS